MNKQELYRRIPKVDQLMERAQMRALSEQYGSSLILTCTREVLDEIRKQIAALSDNSVDGSHLVEPEQVEKRVSARAAEVGQPQLRRVINATGTVLHTNLGRAPLSRNAVRQMAGAATGNINIEYSLKTGMRGKRAGGCEELLARLTGAEDALVVNNNAAGIMLILNTFCRGHEVIVSRGELVEIGGQFRMPDVMQAGEAILKEVGTTNKTHLKDYERAVTPETAAIMKVHTSNYKILGFTESVSIGELATLAREKNLLLIEDLGSGALIDLARYGVGNEPTVGQSVHDGADLVCFSADKLLGGPQAGIVLGRKALIQRMKAHPMMRALRIDKLVAAALEMTLLTYLDTDRAVKEIPVLSMMTAKEQELQIKAEHLAQIIRDRQEAHELRDVTISTESCEDQVGGGSMPTVMLKGCAVRIHLPAPCNDALQMRLLSLPLPIIGRYADGDLWLSLRTIDEDDFDRIAEELCTVFVKYKAGEPE